MIAIPLNEKSSTTISDLYGNAPYFAMLDTESGYFKIEKNKGCGNGIDTAQYIKNLGAKSTIFYHMGEGVFKHLDENAVKVYSSSKTYLSIEEIYRKLLKNSCKLVTPSNADTLLDSGTISCSCKM